MRTKVAASAGAVAGRGTVGEDGFTGAAGTQILACGGCVRHQVLEFSCAHRKARAERPAPGVEQVQGGGGGGYHRPDSQAAQVRSDTRLLASTTRSPLVQVLLLTVQASVRPSTVETGLKRPGVPGWVEGRGHESMRKQVGRGKRAASRGGQSTAGLADRPDGQALQVRSLVVLSGKST